MLRVLRVQRVKDHRIRDASYVRQEHDLTRRSRQARAPRRAQRYWLRWIRSASRRSRTVSSCSACDCANCSMQDITKLTTRPSMMAPKGVGCSETSHRLKAGPDRKLSSSLVHSHLHSLGAAELALFPGRRAGCSQMPWLAAASLFWAVMWATVSCVVTEPENLPPTQVETH